MAHFVRPDENLNVHIFRMIDNNSDGSRYDLPVFVRKYNDKKFNENNPRCTSDVLHTHDSIQINYVRHGNLKHIVNNTVYDLIKGDIFVIPPFVPHGLAQKDDCDFEVVELEFLPEFVFGKDRSMENIDGIFDFAYVEPFLVSECNVKPRLNLSGKLQKDVEEILKNLLDEFAERKPSFLLAMKASVLQLLVLVGRAFNDSVSDGKTRELFERHREAISEAIAYVDEHYKENITVDKISRLAMLSQSYFSYLFKSITEKTFVEYLNDLRIREAMQLLMYTGKRVIDICYETGFKNVNHFNRTFKKTVGVSPMQYRSNFKNSQNSEEDEK